MSRNGAHIHDVPTPIPGADPGAPIVRLEEVRKSFGALRVLDGVSLSIKTGENTVVLGPSGAGKSVLLKHIVGLLRPDSGAVLFRGVRVDDVPERHLTEVRRNIGFLFQMAALFDSMNVEENVAFPLVEHTDLNKQERRDRVAAALRTVEMDGSQKKLPAELSGGQRKRVGLARAVILKPALVLYDEPTTGLDPIRADGINDLILKMRDSLGLTGVIVTHDLASARKIADRVVVLYEGKIVADGTFEQVERSEHPYVQRFMSGTYHPDARPQQPHARATPQEPL
ncbi:MAG: ABC transporter ATP-binding protein [Phycisphaerales bacterium]